LQAAVSQQPGDLGLLMTLAHTYLIDQKVADDRRCWIQAAVAVAPTNAAVHYNLGVTLQGKGQVDEASACFRKAIALKPEYTQARVQLERAERLAATRDKFTAFRNGTYTPATPAECLNLVEWCKAKELHHTAAGLYAAAFAADSRLADDLQLGYRYNAVGHAALAAAGQGEDAAKLDDKERTRLRQQALAWLCADLALWAKQLKSGQPADRGAVQQTLKDWQQKTDLADLRDAAALAKLPAEEQKAWTQLWADVAELRKKAEEKPN
jgi:tetratricopeptide (TPR) repeat protein